MIDDSKVCPECGNLNPFQDDRNGEIICQECGLVLTEKIPMFLDGGIRNPYKHHIGDPLSLAHWDKKLITYIPRRNIDSDKKEVSPSMSFLINRLKKWQHRIDSKDRGLSIMLNILRSFSLLLDTKEPVTDEAILILRKFFKENNVMGRTYESFVAAVFYAACKMKRNPRSIKEISHITSVSKKDIGRNYKFLVKTLKLQIPLLKLSEYLPRVAALNGVSMKVEKRALEILNNVNVNESSGKVPWGIAGAAIYIAAKEYGENITQRKVAETVGATEATIRNRYKQIKRFIKLQ